MAYEQFAYIYDELMQDVPYDQWVDWVKAYVPTGSTIADIGCGTGTATLALAAHYEMLGIDLSEEMLEVAQEKRWKRDYAFNSGRKTCAKSNCRHLSMP